MDASGSLASASMLAGANAEAEASAGAGAGAETGAKKTSVMARLRKLNPLGKSSKDAVKATLSDADQLHSFDVGSDIRQVDPPWGITQFINHVSFAELAGQIEPIRSPCKAAAGWKGVDVDPTKKPSVGTNTDSESESSMPAVPSRAQLKQIETVRERLFDIVQGVTKGRRIKDMLYAYPIRAFDAKMERGEYRVRAIPKRTQRPTRRRGKGQGSSSSSSSTNSSSSDTDPGSLDDSKATQLGGVVLNRDHSDPNHVLVESFDTQHYPESTTLTDLRDACVTMRYLVTQVQRIERLPSPWITGCYSGIKPKKVRSTVIHATNSIVFDALTIHAARMTLAWSLAMRCPLFDSKHPICRSDGVLEKTKLDEASSLESEAAFAATGFTDSSLLTTPPALPMYNGEFERFILRPLQKRTEFVQTALLTARATLFLKRFLLHKEGLELYEQGPPEIRQAILEKLYRLYTAELYFCTALRFLTETLQLKEQDFKSSTEGYSAEEVKAAASARADNVWIVIRQGYACTAVASGIVEGGEGNGYDDDNDGGGDDGDDAAAGAAGGAGGGEGGASGSKSGDPSNDLAHDISNSFRRHTDARMEQFKTLRDLNYIGKYLTKTMTERTNKNVLGLMAQLRSDAAKTQTPLHRMEQGFIWSIFRAPLETLYQSALMRFQRTFTASTSVVPSEGQTMSQREYSLTNVKYIQPCDREWRPIFARIELLKYVSRPQPQPPPSRPPSGGSAVGRQPVAILARVTTKPPQLPPVSQAVLADVSLPKPKSTQPTPVVNITTHLPTPPTAAIEIVRPVSPAKIAPV